MKQIGHLKLNGQKFQPRYSRAEVRLKEYLASMADDESLQITHLARLGGFSMGTIMLAKEELLRTGLAYEHSAHVYYGNKKAIASLKVFLNRPPPQP